MHGGAGIAQEHQEEEQWRRRLYALWATPFDELQEAIALRGLDYSQDSQAALVACMLDYEKSLEDAGDANDETEQEQETTEGESEGEAVVGESWVLGTDDPRRDGGTVSSPPSSMAAGALAARRRVTDPIPPHLASFIAQLQDEHRLLDIRILEQPPNSHIGAHLVLASGQTSDQVRTCSTGACTINRPFETMHD